MQKNKNECSDKKGHQIVTNELTIRNMVAPDDEPITSADSDEQCQWVINTFSFICVGDRVGWQHPIVHRGNHEKE